jgi:3-carboxy-cis,cis-muconate cycloisomerase
LKIKNQKMYLKDPNIAKLTSAENHIQKMLVFEMALAKVQGDLGVIPKEAADAISEHLKGLTISPEQLEEGTLLNGIPTITLLEIAKKSLTDFAKDYLHFGATSQDVMDTAQVLLLKEVSENIEISLKAISKNLGLLIENEGSTVMIGRTRTQQAVPILFGQKIANWVNPLLRHLERLQEIKTRLFVLQFGGAAGNLSALGGKGSKISEKLAIELGLNNSNPWHNQRDNFAEFASWLAILSGLLGKIGADILVMAQTEIGEIIENGNGGKSSTMPHKNNPILSEALVVLARKNAALISIQMQSLMHASERDGTAWALEWDNLPEMINNAGTALTHANTISKNLKINHLAIQKNLDLTNGLIFSEAATFILAQKIPKSEAKIIIEKACERVINEQKSLALILNEIMANLKIDWVEELKAEKHLGISTQIINDVLTKIKALN